MTHQPNAQCSQAGGCVLPLQRGRRCRHDGTHAPRRHVAEDAVPLSVWATAQRDARSQRRGRYLPGSAAHPGKMLPAIAAHAITTFTRPGDLVVDPMCGIGTTLVEAVHAERDAFGVEYEQQWVDLARANLALAADQGAIGHATLVCADARTLPATAPLDRLGRAALILTSPPYGKSVHGQARSSRDTGRPGVTKFHDSYGDRHDPANLANAHLDALLEGFTRILTGATQLLRPGGTIVITTRPWREHGELVDLPSAVIAAGQRAGLVHTERCVALLAGLRHGRLVPRASFFQLTHVRRARAKGIPMHLIVHEDVLIFQRPSMEASSATFAGIPDGDAHSVLAAA